MRFFLDISPGCRSEQFSDAYYALVQGQAPQLSMPPSKLRAAGHTWFQFQPAGMAKGLQIFHQAYGGAVKLFFNGSNGRFAEIVDRLEGLLPPGAKIEGAGKSVAISISVPPIKSLQVPFETVVPDVMEAIFAATKLAALAVRPEVNELAAQLRQ